MSEVVSNEPRIVVGVDGSLASREALRWALRIARGEHALINVVGAWEVPSDGWGAVPTDQRSEAEVEKSVTDAVDEVFGTDRPAYLDIRIREGHPVPVLLAASSGALMLIVGSRGHGGFAGLLLGSVSARVAELASCPVLVVHAAPVLADVGVPAWETT